MSFYRQLDRSMWGDERIQTVGPVARAVFNYLCHNEQDDLCGLYRLSLARAEEDTGWTVEQLRESLSELEQAVDEDGVGLVHYDPKTRVVWVTNMLAKQGGKRDGGVAPRCMQHTVRQLKHLPRTELKARMVAYYAARGVEMPYAESQPVADRVSETESQIPYTESEQTPDTLSETETQSPKPSFSVSASASVSDSDLQDRIARAAALRTDAVPDPLAAAHDADVADVLRTEPPRQCRRWGPSDAAEIHRQIRAFGLEHVRAVVAFVREAVEERRVFDDVETAPKAWSYLWRYDGEPWARWDQRYAESDAQPEPESEQPERYVIRDGVHWRVRGPFWAEAMPSWEVEKVLAAGHVFEKETTDE